MKYNDLLSILQSIAELPLIENGVSVESCDLKMKIAEDGEVKFEESSMSFPENTITVGNIVISDMDIKSNSDQIIIGKIPVDIIEKHIFLPTSLLPKLDNKRVNVAINRNPVTSIEIDVGGNVVEIPPQS